MLNICYYSSDYYAPYTGISMLSLCENNIDLDFRIYCIDAGISDDNKDKMRQVATQYRKPFEFMEFINIERYLINELKFPEINGSYATYIKIFPDLIFPDLEEILFMDGDTIIDGSLKEFAEIDMENYLFAAVKVPLIQDKKLYKHPDPKNIRLQYALKFMEDGYYNIGVCLVNLKKWRETKFGELILSKREKHVVYMSKAHDVPVDEMLFNLAAKEDIGMKYVRELHPKFNSILHNIPYPRAVISSQYCGYLDKKKQQEAYFHPVVIHYCIFKLWYTDAYSRYRRLGNEYTSRSPWPKPFTETIYKTKHEKFYGKYIYSLPYDWMIALASRTYHTFLWLLSVFTNKIHREKRYHKPPHFIRAIIRRGAFLKDRDIKATFSLPEKFRGANNKLTKN